MVIVTHPVSTPAQFAFRRDRFTWLAYGMLGYFAYLQAAPGPAMPLLRDDLALSFTAGGLHFSALAAGMVLAGLLTDRLTARHGRHTVFWTGGGGMGLGAALFALGQHPALTILGAGVMGLLGTALLATVQSSLADHHRARRAQALTEANVAAIGSAMLPPLLIGGFERVGVGWRAAFLIGPLVWGLVYAGLRREPIPAPAAGPTSAGTRVRENRARAAEPLPGVFWAYWVALLLGVAIEWSLVSWGADFMVERAGFAEADASLLMTAFFGAMLVGRAAGSRLTRDRDNRRLIVLALLVALAGFVLFWRVMVPALMVAGLFLAGLGIANVFPFLLALAVSAAEDRADRASARVSLAAGLAILLAPQALGTLADLTTIATAYGLVFALGWLALAVVSYANRLED